MHNNHHYHFLIEQLLTDNLSKIYIYQALLTFVKSLIGIFVPVFLYKMGYSIIAILIYSIINSITYLVLVPLSTRIIKKLGFKYSLLLTTPIYLAHIITLNFIDGSWFFYSISALSYGVYVSLFWPVMHSEIAKQGHSKSRGKEMGTFQIIITLVSTIAPFIGGIFLENIGYFYLLIFSSILLFLGYIPLLFSNDLKVEKEVFHYKDYIRLLKDSNLKNSKIAFSAEGFESILSISIWPILIFILLGGDFVKFGTLLTVVSFISIIFMFYFRVYLDKHDKNIILKKLTYLVSLKWIFKIFIISFGMFFLYIIESFSKILQNTFNSSYQSIFYNNANKVNYMDYIIMRELYLHGTKMLFVFCILIPLFLIFGENVITISSSLVFGIFFAYFLSFMNEI